MIYEEDKWRFEIKREERRIDGTVRYENENLMREEEIDLRRKEASDHEVEAER